MSYRPYDKTNATPVEKLAWALCQIIDDDAPIRWARYIFVAECLIHSDEFKSLYRSIAETKP
jgi:hypothetical protein